MPLGEGVLTPRISWQINSRNSESTSLSVLYCKPAAVKLISTKHEQSVLCHCFENAILVALVCVVGSEVPNKTWNSSAFQISGAPLHLAQIKIQPKG